MLINTAHIYAYFNMPEHLANCLNNNTSFLFSKKGLSPLDISHQRGHTECVNVIVNNILKQSNDKLVNCFKGETLADLNYKGYKCLDKVYFNLLVKSQSKSLPKACSLNQVLPIITLSDNFEPVTSEFGLRLLTGGDGKLVEFYQSAIKLDMAIGTQESIKFMDSIVRSPNDDIFKSSLMGFMLEKKWDDIKWTMRLNALKYLTLVLLFSLLGLSEGFYLPILIINLYLSYIDIAPRLVIPNIEITI